MLTTSHLIHPIVQLVGTGLVLASLLGGVFWPAESAAEGGPTAYGEYRDSQAFQGYQDYQRYQDYRPYGRPRYAQPDRFTIRKGKKCELRCERIRGSREYHCREYRC
jgi:hypothetical protein